MKKPLITITASLAILFGIGSAANAASNTYTVKSGDTLSKIAKSEHTTVSKLKEWNHLSSDLIKINEVLTIVKPSKTVNHSVKTITVSSSAYTMNCKHCSGITATGINLKKNPHAKIISVDPKIIKLGTKVYIPGYGYAIAADTGGAIKGNKVDIFMPSLKDALTWGRKTITIQLLD